MNKEYFLSGVTHHRFAKHFLAASVITLVAACGGGSSDTSSSPPSVLPTGSIKQIFDATVDMAGSQPAAMQGMSVGLQTDDGQTWLRGVGFKDNAKKIPTDPQSQYRQRYFNLWIRGSSLWTRLCRKFFLTWPRLFPTRRQSL